MDPVTVQANWFLNPPDFSLMHDDTLVAPLHIVTHVPAFLSEVVLVAQV